MLDIADAFWLFPLAPEERKWFTRKLRGKYYVFLRNAEGSRNAPLGWERVAALLARLTQSMFSTDEVLMEVYTDDPRDWRLQVCAQRVSLSHHSALDGTRPPIVVEERFARHRSVVDCRRIHHSFWTSSPRCQSEARLRQRNVISHRDLSTLIGKLGNIAIFFCGHDARGDRGET